MISDVVYLSVTSTGSGLVDPSQHFTLLAQQIWRLSISFPLLIDAESNLSCTYVFSLTILFFLSSFFLIELVDVKHYHHDLLINTYFLYYHPLEFFFCQIKTNNFLLIILDMNIAHYW